MGKLAVTDNDAQQGVSTDREGAWTLHRIVDRTVTIYREEGLYSLWAKFWGEFCYRRLYYLERPLALPFPDLHAALPLEITPMERDEIDAYIAFHDEDPRDQIERRFALGEKCFVARSGGEIVCANWACEGGPLSEHWIRYLRYALPVAPDEVYLYDSYTAPTHRGRGIAPALAVWILRHYAEKGYRRTTTAIVPENRTNLRARAKSGYQICGRIGYVRTGIHLHHFNTDRSRSNLRSAPGERPR